MPKQQSKNLYISRYITQYNTRQTVRKQMHSLPTPSAKLKASRAPRTSNLKLRHQTKQKATWAEQATQKKEPKLAIRKGRTHIPEVEETVQEANCCTRKHKQRTSQAQATKPTAHEALTALSNLIYIKIHHTTQHNTRQTVREQMHSLPTPSAKLKASRAPRTGSLNLRHQTKQKASWAEQATHKKNLS